MVTKELVVLYQPLGSLRAHPGNARTHSKHQIRQIAESIRVFGFTNPVMIDLDNRIIAGHGRVAAAKLLGMEQIPTLRLEGLSPDQIRAYVIADNKLAENAGWDKSILAIELQHLLNIDTDFDVPITGFEVAEIDLLLADGDTKPDKDDAFEVEENSNGVTQLDDIWKLGKHRVLCGSAIEENCHSTLMDSKRAAVVFVDPPYNVPIRGNVSGNGAIVHREFPMGSGEMDPSEFTSFLASSFELLARYSTPGSVHFSCMDFRHMSEILAAGKQVYDTLLNVCVWVKNVGGMGSLYPLPIPAMMSGLSKNFGSLRHSISPRAIHSFHI